jgi:hypothetical protein
LWKGEGRGADYLGQVLEKFLRAFGVPEQGHELRPELDVLSAGVFKEGGSVLRRQRPRLSI